MDIYQHSKLYDAYYYSRARAGRASSDHSCGSDWEHNEERLAFFRSIADRIVTEIQPHTVLDAGCAMGLLVEFLRKREVEAYGIDISEYAIQNVRQEVKPFCWIGSVSQPFPQKYDLIVCIEVLEHLPHFEAEKAIENFCQHSDDVLFSSTPFDFREETHFNVQPLEYWAEAFARYGFYRDVDFNASFITPWAVRFRRQNEPLERLVRKYEHRFFLLWKENVDLRDMLLNMRQELANNEQVIHRLKNQLAERGQNITPASSHHLDSVLIQEPLKPGLVSIIQSPFRKLKSSAFINRVLKKLGL